jgi:2-C-methyl-D-erythritol 4-phosphate cytidylyltransferase
VAAWSVAAARTVADGVVLVVPDDAGHDPEQGATEPGATESGPMSWGADRTVTGGESRADSVRAGLDAVPDEATVIVVHDAARPLAPPSLFAAVVEAVLVDGAPCAIPVLPVADTLKRAADGVILATIDRDGLVTVQTPQAFSAATLRAAHRQGGQSTDDAGLVEQMGVAVHTVPGDPRNLKITRPEDLDLAEALMVEAPR